MTKTALHELAEQVKDDDIDVVVYTLSRFIRGGFEEDEPLPDEIEAIREAEEAQARGERFFRLKRSWENRSSITAKNNSQTHTVWV